MAGGSAERWAKRCTSRRVIAGASSAGVRLPGTVLDVYGPAELLLFGLAGLVIAVVGALLPAGWAARTRVAVALRTE
jgi:putative ABC transport system permease protein